MFESIFGFDFWWMVVGGFLLALAPFFIVTHCVGCLLSGRGSNVDRGAGFLFILVLVIPASIALSTGAYYGVQSTVAIVVERVEIEHQCGGSSSSSEEADPSLEPKLDSRKWLSLHGSPEFGDGVLNGKPKINL
jgi:hypothetical protein